MIKPNDPDDPNQLKTYVVSLVNGDKKRVQAEDIDIESGALCGIRFDWCPCTRQERPGEFIWSFAPGTWLFVHHKGHGNGGMAFHGHRGIVRCLDCNHVWASTHPASGRVRWDEKRK